MIALALSRPGRLAGAADDLAAEVAEYVVAAAAPAIESRVQAAIPGLAAQFVDAAMPRVQQQMATLEPQFRELAVSSAQAVLSDEQIKATLSESIGRVEKKMEKGFMLATAVAVIGTTVAVVSLLRK